MTQQTENNPALGTSRRDMLRRSGTGFGMLGLAAMLESEKASAVGPASQAGVVSPLVPKPPQKFSFVLTMN